jgi:hypothetical protein
MIQQLLTWYIAILMAGIFLAIIYYLVANLCLILRAIGLYLLDQWNPEEEEFLSTPSGARVPKMRKPVRAFV